MKYELTEADCRKLISAKAGDLAGMVLAFGHPNRSTRADVRRAAQELHELAAGISTEEEAQ